MVFAHLLSASVGSSWHVREFLLGICTLRALPLTLTLNSDLCRNPLGIPSEASQHHLIGGIPLGVWKCKLYYAALIFERFSK